MTTSFNINKADLEFILKQIKIAENTSLGYTPSIAPVSIKQAIMDAYGLSAADATIAPYGLRTVDGSYNNLLSESTSTLGAADTLFPRLTDPVYIKDTDGDTIDFNGPALGGTLTQGDYAQAGNVVDADPRTISNLIVDMSVNNPAAIAAFLSNPLSVAYYKDTHNGTAPTAGNLTNEDLQVLPTQSPDIGLSPGFNSWMTIFGQFFDHGLDLVTKGNNGTVYIPLQPDDPLIAGADGILVDNPTTEVNEAADNLPAHLQFMALTRATPTIINGLAQHQNTTTAFIDQNQTYTSHSAHQAFLREYKKEGGVAVSTGRLLDGTKAGGSADGAIANWGEIKAQSVAMLGIKLNDFDVHDVPLLATDQYGKFIPSANGFAQVTVQVQILDSSGKVIGTMGSPFLMSGVAGGLDLANLSLPNGLPTLPAGQTYKTATVGTGHAFLNDISHHAAPGFADLDHNGSKETKQVADTDVLDFNGDGVINATDLTEGTASTVLVKIKDANNSGGIDLDDLRDVNLDGMINAADRVADDRNPTTYDDEMLNAHFITGDGRGNENIGLTSVHSVFHSEHNRVLEENKLTVLKSGDLNFINEWLVTDLTAADLSNILANPASLATSAANLNWDGERLFQAARFTTEMQYQHLVFEEFARRMQPAVDPFVFNNSPNIDPSIVAEFAHTVYRFGHSMLTGTVDRLDNNLNLLNGDTSQQTLVAMFLNPQAYLGSGTDAAEINANLVRGLSRDVGNAIDEFIVTDLRSNLLGLPLDLGALNIARGRETGVPSLNETRRQLYNDTGLADLKPYTSWSDFAANIKNATSVINFIAAYGTHAELLKADVDTMVEKRAVATALVLGGTATINAGTTNQRIFAPTTTDRLDFLKARGTYGNDHGGLDLVDLWIGGLAEKNPEFGGMLGTTFNYVFEAQMENLQNGDRMYYLSRTQGTNILNQLEPNTFSDLVMRNTALGGVYATHLNANLFVTPDHILELDRGIAQEDYNGNDPGKDPKWVGLSPIDEAILGPKVVRDYAGNGDTSNNGHDEGGYLQFQGGEHVVLGGTEGNDTLIGDKGIDALWGDGGNDYLNAGTESDNVFGGEGDDIIEDPFGDDLLRGNQGNDVITSARGVDILFGDQGTDYIVVGQDAGEVFGGQDDDFILGGSGGDALLGNEGNDWIEGGNGFDGVTGDNSELFFNSPIIGHDVLFGQGDETDYDAESGDDIMSSAGGTVIRYNGMFGFDWGIAKNDSAGVNFDLRPAVLPILPAKILRDRFDLVEAASGWNYDDHLDGDDRDGTAGIFDDHVLTADGIARITNLGNLVNPAIMTYGLANNTFRNGNILLGGDGNDSLQGHGGNDILDGDAWLNVRIKIVIPTGQPNAGTYSAESLNTDTSVAGQYAGKVYHTNPDGSPNFSSVAFGGRSLTSLMLDRTINPGQMSIVREILDGTIAQNETDDDTAVFQGNYAEYTIEGRTTTGTGFVTRAAFDLNNDGFISVTDTLATRAVSDGHDLLKNIELLKFANQTVRISGKTSLSINAVNNATSANLSALVTGFNSPSIANYTYQWYSSADQGVTPVLITGATLATQSAVSNSLSRVVVNYSDLFGPNTLTSSWVQVGTSGNDTLQGSIAPDDTLIGLDGDDLLSGGVGNDTMYGGDGNDILESHGDSIGIDSLSGGKGNDTYGVYNSATLIVENAAEGTDTVWTQVNYTLSDNIENMYLVGAITGTGNAGDNVIMVHGADNHTINGVAGNDYLIGGAGIDLLNGGTDDDYLKGGLGADSLNGESGDDILENSDDGISIDTFAGGDGDDTYGIYNSATLIVENAGEGIDTVWAAVNYTLSDNIENMYLVGAITGTGNASNNIIMGYGVANQTIYGMDGNDLLQGEAGDDTIDGGNGSDTMSGGTGADVFAFRFGQSSVTLTDRILDFTISTDQIDLFSPTGVAAAAPSSFIRTNNDSSANLADLAASAYTGGLVTGGAALVVSTGAVSGTYLVIDDGVAGFNATNDLVINITGVAGALPSVGAITPVSSFFKV